MRLHFGLIKFERTTWKNNPLIYVCTLSALSVVERLGMGRKVKSQDLEDGLEARGLSEGTSSTVCKDEGHRGRRSQSPQSPLFLFFLYLYKRSLCPMVSALPCHK